MRLFTAFQLSHEAKHAAQEVQLRLKEQLKCKWQPLGNLHITLHFLGETSTKQAEGVIQALEEHCANHSPFQLTMGQLGAFPNERRPRILWLGIEGELERLMRLQRDTAQALQPFGYAEANKDYKPHITLGREPQYTLRLEEWNNRLLPASPPAWTVDQVILFQSELRPSGAVHTPLHHFSLSNTMVVS